MIVGTQSLPVLVTDVSGGTINTSAGWVVFGRVGSEMIYDAAPVVTMDGSGYHMVPVTIPAAGNGYVAFKCGTYELTPSFYDIIDATLVNVDTVNAAVARQANDRTSTLIGNYEELDAGKFKHGDDILFTYVVPDAIATSISGWTSFNAQLRDNNAKTTNTTAYQTFDLTVDTVNKSVAFSLPASASALLTIADGEQAAVYWTDLQALNTASKKVTLTEIMLTIVRDITKI